jgi:hypothetical protein
MIACFTLGLLGTSISWTLATFTSAETNGANTFSVGTVALSDNDAGSQMLALTAAKPADSDTSCIRVSYTGSGPTTVRLYGTTTGTGLDAYLTLAVTRGTVSSPSFDSCTGFTPDTTNYIEAGAGVVYLGSLQGFADTYTGASVDPAPAFPETWTTGETHDYRFVITLGNSDAAQGKTVTQTFTWEARNL